MIGIWWRMSGRDRAAVCVLVPILLAFFAWIIVGNFLMFWISGALLRAHGVPVEGVVTRIGAHNQIRYTWMVDGHKFEAEDGTGHPMFAAGDTIPLRYLPESPSVAHFDWKKLEWRGQVGFLVSLAMWVGTCMLLLGKLRRDYPA